MSDVNSKDTLSIAALGRHFQLGSLYDCRSDKIMPISCWSNEMGDPKTIWEPSADFEFIESDTIQGKTHSMGLNGGLKLSVLSGLVDVSGSGEFLKNRKSSIHQMRGTLRYKWKTKYEVINLNQLNMMIEKIEKYQQLFHHDMCTHIVTSIEYGGSAFLVFDKEMSSSNKTTDVNGNLQALVDKIPYLSKGDVQGGVDLNENENEEVKKFTCRYFGDFSPTKTPTTYEDAVFLCKDMSELTKAHSVPVKVSLYPLNVLNDKFAQIVQDINSIIVNEIENILENLDEFDIRCNDLLKSQPVLMFKELEKEIKAIRYNIANYKLIFLEKLRKMLPLIRRGDSDQHEIVKLLKARETSPFSNNALETLLKIKERNVKTLNEYISSLSPISFSSDRDNLEAKVISSNYTYVFCFVISIPMGISRQSLAHMSKFLKSEQYDDDTPSDRNTTGIPYRNIDNERSMMDKARYFRTLYDANSTEQGESFIMVGELCDSTEFQANIECYKNGRCESFIPIDPQNVNVNNEQITHDGFTVTWEMPSQEIYTISHYEIICEKKDGCTKVLTQKIGSRSLCHSIKDLEPACEYEISVQSVSEFGLSHRISKTIRTKPTSPPRMLLAQMKNSTDVENTIFLSWNKPSVISSKVNIINYILKQEIDNGGWNEIPMDVAIRCLKITLSSYLKVVYKVCCNCGDPGRSLDSEEFIVQNDSTLITISYGSCN